MLYNVSERTPKKELKKDTKDPETSKLLKISKKYHATRAPSLKPTDSLTRGKLTKDPKMIKSQVRIDLSKML